MTATLAVPFPWFGEAAQGHYRAEVMDDRLTLLHEIADAVSGAFGKVRDFGLSGQREGQYKLDLVADEAALQVIHREEPRGALRGERVAGGQWPGDHRDRPDRRQHQCQPWRAVVRHLAVLGQRRYP
jgi:hypothetical protein